MLRVSVLGTGRMGREILRALAAHDGDADAGLQIAGLWARHAGGTRDRELVRLVRAARGDLAPDTDLRAVLAAADVAVDFTLPAATAEVLEAAVAAGTPLVSGVTGHDQSGIRAMHAAAREIPLFHARNMSVGIAVLVRLLREAGMLLGPDYVPVIGERHHAGKRDAPSGTALMLGETIAAARAGLDAGDIRYDVVREGECPGSHTARLEGPADVLTLGHEVRDRRVFAAGALRAARWLAGREPGHYGMEDMLGAGAASAQGPSGVYRPA